MAIHGGDEAVQEIAARVALANSEWLLEEMFGKTGPYGAGCANLAELLEACNSLRNSESPSPRKPDLTLGDMTGLLRAYAKGVANELYAGKLPFSAMEKPTTVDLESPYLFAAKCHILHGVLELSPQKTDGWASGGAPKVEIETVVEFFDGLRAKMRECALESKQYEEAFEAVSGASKNILDEMTVRGANFREAANRCGLYDDIEAMLNRNFGPTSDALIVMHKALTNKIANAGGKGISIGDCFTIEGEELAKGSVKQLSPYVKEFIDGNLISSLQGGYTIEQPELFIECMLATSTPDDFFLALSNMFG